VCRDEPSRSAAGLALGYGFLDLVNLELAEALDLEEAAAGTHGRELFSRQLLGNFLFSERWGLGWDTRRMAYPDGVQLGGFQFLDVGGADA
jgi:hypothetical protein